MNHPCSYLALKAHTWPAHGDELFDYHARSLVTDAYKLISEYYLVRVGDHVRPVTSLSDYTDTPVLARISRRPQSSRFAIFVDPHCNTESLWLSTKFLKENSHPLTIGSVVRVGEVTLEALDVGWDSEEEENGREEQLEVELGPDEGCRICYSDSNTPDDPLLSPCLCSGTMRFIHLKCLQQSLAPVLTSRVTSHVLSYQWKELKCRICQSALQLTFPDKRYAVPIPHTSKAHITLKATGPDFNGLYLITPEREEATVGRGHDSDVVLPFATVSRLHAKLKIEEGQFILQDCESRFGTIIKVPRYDFVGSEEIVGLQIGKTMITFKAGQ